MSKPFNLTDAKAGHPVAIANAIPGAAGLNNTVPAKILTADLNNAWCVVVSYFHGEDERVVKFLADGTNPKGEENIHTLAHLVMAPIGTIDGKPVYPGDMITTGGDPFAVTVNDGKCADIAWADAKWPRQYPETQMNNEEVRKALHDAVQHIDVANAAIRHGIDNGYLLDPTQAAKNISIKLPEMSQEELGRLMSDDGKHVGKLQWAPNDDTEVLQAIATAINAQPGLGYKHLPALLKTRERKLVYAGIRNSEDCHGICHRDYSVAYIDDLIAKVK